MEFKNSVQRQLRDRNGIIVQNEWLEACIQWIVDEEVPQPSKERLYQLVYEQWLYADLRDISPSVSIPPLTADKGLLTGTFIVQITSVVDVGCAAYAQLQKIQEKSIDSVEGSDKKGFEPKPTRLLLITLCDGASEIKAMEYKPIQQLRAHTTPGTKLVLQGEIPYRLGMLLLSEDNVQVLGGAVEQLSSHNSIIRVLTRLLHIEESANEATTSIPPALPPSETVPIPATPIPQQQTTAGSANSIIVATKQQTYDFQDEMDDFDDFAGELIRTELLDGVNDTVPHDGGSTVDDHEEVGQETIDEPGHEDWPDELSDELFDGNIDYDSMPQDELPNIKCEPIRPTIKPETQPGSTLNSSTSNVVKSEQVSRTGRLSLKQQSSRMRMAQVGPLRGPLIASVCPMQNIKTESGSAERQKPFLINSFSELSDSFWAAHPIVKVCARFVCVSEKITHIDGVWAAKMDMMDMSGVRMTVDLSNEILETMIGFSAVDFRDHISPYKNNPGIRAKAGKGFARCQSLIAQLNCLMVIAKYTAAEYPCVIKLLDSSY